MALDPWSEISGPARKIMVVGDSVPGDNHNGTEPHWPARLRALLAPVWGYGGEGYFGLWRPEWAAAGSWSRAARDDAWNRAPWGQTYTASGAGNVFTFTTNRDSVTGPIAGFDIYYVDGPRAASFAYRVDGSDWVDGPGTFSAANRLRRTTVDRPVTSTIDIRAADAAGTAVTTYLAGVGLKGNAGQLVIHNLGFGGRKLSHYLATDHTSFIALEAPDLVILNISNDAVDGHRVAAWNARLDTFWQGVLGAKLGVAVAEQNFGRDVGRQRAWREAQQQVVTAHRGEWLDLHERWGDFATADASGFWFDVGIHPSPAGYADMAERIAEVLTVRDGGGHRLGTPETR
jgi:hypothetical protein